jgi:3-hydroxybutyryl-CoA dehydrogenase
MRLLMTGNTTLIGEWLDLCAEHQCIVLKDDIAIPLPPHATLGSVDDDLAGMDLVIDLHWKASGKRRTRLQALEARIGADTPVLSNTVAAPLSRVQSWLRHPSRVYGISALPTLTQYPVVELSIGDPMFDQSASGQDPEPHDVGVMPEQQDAPSAGSRDATLPAILVDFFTGLGKHIETHREGIGHVFPRILCMIINEAVYALQQGIAGADDIDAAMTLGVNYPAGPLAWAERIGWRGVLLVLDAMHREYGDDRYRPAPLLRSLAARLPASTAMQGISNR